MSSTLLKHIRKTKTQEQYLAYLISNLEYLIKYCSNQYLNNVAEVFLEESGGEFTFTNNSFEKIKNYIKVSEISSNEKKLIYANILWDIIVKIDYYDLELSTSHKIIFNNNNFNFSGDIYVAVLASIKESKNYLINFEAKNGFIFLNEKYLIDYIGDENFSNLFYLYKNSKTFKEKESHLSTICKKTVFLFMEKKSPDKTIDFIKEKIGEDKALILCGKMHGYFRHTSNDSFGKEAEEWALFNEQEKREICEEIFIDLLYILALLGVKKLLPEIKW